MRDIKFRVWDKSGAKWMTGLAIGMENGHVIGCSQGWENFPVQQYTGLKDKNGVEIYEGDVIDTHVASGRYMKVWYNEDNAGFNTEGLGDIDWVKTGGLGKDMSSYIEVIGNIYENPELLK